MKLSRAYRLPAEMTIAYESFITLKKQYIMMKMSYKILCFAILLTAVSFSSCTKEDGVFNSDDTGGIIEISDLAARASSTDYVVVNKSFETAAEVEFPVTLNYTGVAGAPQDITVTMEMSTTKLNAYNLTLDTADRYTELPSNVYTVDSYNVTIAKGSKTGKFIIKLNTSAFDFKYNYAVAIAIKSATAGIVSGNYGSGIFTLAAKNKWDGVYTVTNGTMVDVYSSTLTHINNYLSVKGLGQMEYSLTTVSATKCALLDSKLTGGFYTPITSGGTARSYYGTFGLIFEFDPTTNAIIGVTNYYGTVTNTRAGRLDPSGVNTYNPDTKTINVKYNMLQPSVITVSPYVRTTWTETMVYKAARE